MDAEPTDWTCLRQAQTYKAIAEAALVLSALSIAHEVTHAESGLWCLWVPPSLVLQAERELELYRRENLPPAWPVPVPVVIDSGWSGVLVFWLLLALVPMLDAWLFQDLGWFTQGAMAAAAVRDGEWWRLLTALMLHGDAAHLLGNLIFGSLFGLLLGRHLGSGFGWLLVVLSAMLANGVNAWLQPDSFLSIGASTATFAALGVVAAFVWYRGYSLRPGFRNPGGRWQRSTMPLAAALGLLIFTGIGGPGVDVMAHFGGFAFGLLAGIFAGWLDPRRLGRSGQWLAGLLVLALLGQAWRRALQAAVSAEDWADYSNWLAGCCAASV